MLLRHLGPSKLKPIYIEKSCAKRQTLNTVIFKAIKYKELLTLSADIFHL